MKEIRCKKCGTVKIKRKNRNICKKCENDYARQYYHEKEKHKPESPERKLQKSINNKKYMKTVRPSGLTNARIHRIQREYNISEEEYLILLSRSNYKCEICKTDLDSKTHAVDHCHANLKVRGILCKRCNFGLGNFRDDTHLLQMAINYLKENE